MKKISIFLLLAFAVASSLNAQTKTTSKKPNWGLKTGINFSNLRVENGTDADWKTGLVFGAFFKIRAGQNFQIQPEFLYSSMGGEITSGSNTGKLRLNYFSIPVMARYQWKPKLALLAGPQIDMLIQAKRKTINNSLLKETNNYKESSFNITAGFEYWPSHCLGLSTRYIYGLSNVAAVGATPLKNQGVQLTAAVKL